MRAIAVFQSFILLVITSSALGQDTIGIRPLLTANLK
jgi:hypothetical protein